MPDPILERGSRHLGTRPVESEAEADYLLELDVRNYGIDARSGRDARLFVVADVILLERILRGLADVSAAAVTDKLREDLRDARRSG